MTEFALALHLANFAVIGALPFTFFKRWGSFNAMWWLTASPLFLCIAFVVAAYLGLVPARPVATAWQVLAFSSLLAIVSMTLIAVTVRTHRVRIALWHQPDDAPEHIVTSGPYRYIRHPFYAAFLLALAGALLFSPQPGTLLTFVVGLAMLNVTAAREERRLRASAFGAEYAAYMASTGRFFPRLERPA